MAKRRVTYAIVVACLFIWLSVEGAPKHQHHHHHEQDLRRSHKQYENPKSRSYIDIDASDPFKVPKSSQYIDQPVPEFSRQVEEKEQHHDDEADGGNAQDDQAPKNFDSIQDDLKKMGLENIDNGASNNNEEPRVEGNAAEEQPIIERESANADPNKPIEIGDVDQNYKHLGEPNSRQNVENAEEEPIEQ